ncbi:MAG: hypothetical protein NVS3B25_09720 [Hymenobacter sp.]
MIPSDLLLTVPEVCTVLRCSRATVFRLLDRGILQRGVNYGRSAVITRASVEAALTAPVHEEARKPPKRAPRPSATTRAELLALTAKR